MSGPDAHTVKHCHYSTAKIPTSDDTFFKYTYPEEKTTTVIGTVNDPKENQEVEEYIMMKGPATYQLPSETMVAD